VANGGESTVSVVDTATRVVSTIDVGKTPKALAFSPDGTAVYVANGRSNTVSVINTATHAVSTIGVGKGPSGVAFSPDGTAAYVTNERDNTISIIDTVTHEVSVTKVGKNPRGVAVSPDGRTVYVANAGGNTISAIATDTGHVSSMAVWGVPISVAVSPDGKNLFVALAGGVYRQRARLTDWVTESAPGDSYGGALLAIPVGNGKRTRINSGMNSSPHAVTVSPDGTRAYVAVAGGIAFSNATDKKPIGAIMLPKVPRGFAGIAVSPDGKTIYATDNADNSLKIIDSDAPTTPVSERPKLEPFAFTKTIIKVVEVGIGLLRAIF
jgi:YVTN family beta-propeller protein